MNKILLAVALSAVSVGSFAAAFNNNVDQDATNDLQLNGVADISLLSIGNTNVNGTNLVNTSTSTVLALTAAASNDVDQNAVNIGQGNGVLSLNGFDLGNTRVTGVNAVNASTHTVGAAGLVSFVIDNDTTQNADTVLQGNGVANAALVSIGNISVDGTNLVNTAQQNLGGLGFVTAVGGNDIYQTAKFIGQGNGVLNAGLVTAGNINVTGVNVVNSAEQNVGSIGVFVDVSAGNSITQSAGDVGQVNGVTDAGILNFGNVDVDGTNLINVAEKNTFAAGILQGVVDNDIDQLAFDSDQSNTVTSLSGLHIGRITVNGTNAANVADASLTALAGAQLVAGNTVTQSADNIGQTNEILVGAVISGGNLRVDGQNVANQATHSIDAFALVEGVINNDINQLATDVDQSNRIGVLAGGNVGSIQVGGVNTINTATLDIDFGVFGIAAGNDITQSGSGLTQYNAVGVAAGVQAGPINVVGVNSINAANLSVIQGTP